MTRSNRRKRPSRAPSVPKVPRVPTIRVNFKAWLLPLVALALTATAVAGLRKVLDRPVRTLVVEGSFRRVSPLQVEAALGPILKRGFLSLRLDLLRERVEQIDWVDSARLRRQWPDKLIVTIVEHRAAARWGDNGLLDVHGDLFAKRAQHAFPELPELAGPDGTEHEVASMYLALRPQLAATNLVLGKLSMDDRGAWSLKLKGGQEVRLGRHNVRLRAMRFFEVVKPALADQFNRVHYVDLRYTNGFAVGWRDGTSESSGSRQLAAGQGIATHG